VAEVVPKLLLALAPVIALQVLLQAYSLYDLAKHRKGSKLPWVIVIVLLGYIGAAAYLIWGRERD